MAISQDRYQQLAAEFAPVKTQVEAVDRKYSLDYNEPLLDMPQSLDLPRLEFTPKTERELREEADLQVKPRYLERLLALNKSYSADVNKTERALLNAEESARKALAKLAADFNTDAETIRSKLIDAGLLYSSALSRITEQRRTQYQADVDNANASADAERNVITKQREVLDLNYNNSVAELEEERNARAQTAYNSLKTKDDAEKIRTEKYNNGLEEKEQKYLYSRARAYEYARQAEYDRAFEARRLRNEIGAAGYEEAIITEKYGILTRYVSALGNREEALAVVQGDNFCRLHLKEYYNTLIDYINRNLN